MVKVKVKPNLELDPPQDFKPFDIEIAEIGWRDRCKLNDGMMKNGEPSFTELGEIAIKYTGLKEEDIHKYWEPGLWKRGDYKGFDWGYRDVSKFPKLLEELCVELDYTSKSLLKNKGE